MNYNYYRTFIRVSADCPAKRPVIPVVRGERVLIAVLEYGLLSSPLFTRRRSCSFWSTSVARGSPDASSNRNAKHCGPISFPGRGRVSGRRSFPGSMDGESIFE